MRTRASSIFVLIVVLLLSFSVCGETSGEKKPSERPFVTAVGAGWLHTCALTRSGGVKCWGRGLWGRLGNGDHRMRPYPVNVIGLQRGVAAIAVGGEHTCALMKRGGVKCWGNNRYGQLGDGTTQNRNTPVDVAGLAGGVVAISAGAFHTCALMNTGGVKCWGFNRYGRLGDGTALDRRAPVDVIGLKGKAVQVSAGLQHTCVLLETGGVKCWGDNYSGQLGTGASGYGQTSYIPVDVDGLEQGVKMIEAGWLHTCAYLEEGTIKCWGRNYKGQLGDGTTINRSRPVKVAGIRGDVAAMSAWAEHTCVLMKSGAVKCWGENEHAQCGDRESNRYLEPRELKGLPADIVAIDTGWRHTCVVTSGGRVGCFGYSRYGQLGEGRRCGRICPEAQEPIWIKKKK